MDISGIHSPQHYILGWRRRHLGERSECGCQLRV